MKQIHYDQEFHSTISRDECYRRLLLMRAIHPNKAGIPAASDQPIKFFWVRFPKFNVRLTVRDSLGIGGDAVASLNGTDFGLTFILYRVIEPWRAVIFVGVIYSLLYLFNQEIRSRNQICFAGFFILFVLINIAQYYWQRHMCGELAEEFQQAMTAPIFDEARFAYPQNPDRPLLIPLLFITAIAVTCFIVFFLFTVR